MPYLFTVCNLVYHPDISVNCIQDETYCTCLLQMQHQRTNQPSQGSTMFDC